MNTDAINCAGCAVFMVDSIRFIDQKRCAQDNNCFMEKIQKTNACNLLMFICKILQLLKCKAYTLLFRFTVVIEFYLGTLYVSTKQYSIHTHLVFLTMFLTITCTISHPVHSGLLSIFHSNQSHLRDRQLMGKVDKHSL